MCIARKSKTCCSGTVTREILITNNIFHGYIAHKHTLRKLCVLLRLPFIFLPIPYNPPAPRQDLQSEQFVHLPKHISLKTFYYQFPSKPDPGKTLFSGHFSSSRFLKIPAHIIFEYMCVLMYLNYLLLTDHITCKCHQRSKSVICIEKC